VCGDMHGTQGSFNRDTAGQGSCVSARGRHQKGAAHWILSGCTRKPGTLLSRTAHAQHVIHQRRRQTSQRGRERRASAVPLQLIWLVCSDQSVSDCPQRRAPSSQSSSSSGARPLQRDGG